MNTYDSLGNSLYDNYAYNMVDHYALLTINSNTLEIENEKIIESNDIEFPADILFEEENGIYNLIFGQIK